MVRDRWAVYALLLLMAAGMMVLHAWWFPKHGVNGVTAEPYDRCLRLIGKGARSFLTRALARRRVRVHDGAQLREPQQEECPMNHRRLAAVCIVVASVALVPALATGQPTGSSAPHTLWGKPDLQGIWDFRTITPMERPEDLGDQEFLTEEEAANLEQEAVDRDTDLLNRSAVRTEAGANVDRGANGAPGAYNNFWLDRGTTTIGTRRTSLIVDPPNGRMPDLTTVGQRRADARSEYRRERPADSYVDRSTSDRCIVGFNAGPPITPLAYNQNMQLFQTPDHLVMVTEMVHTARVIPLDRRPALDDGIRQWSGDSRGYWEGDTLVVETANFNNERRWRGSTANMTLVERFTRVDADTLEYGFTVTDPETWTSTWTASIPMRRTDMPMFEYACHEGNYSMAGILGGARAEEQASAHGSR